MAQKQSRVCVQKYFTEAQETENTITNTQYMSALR